MSGEGKGKLNFLKWCKEDEKLYFNRYGIEPNILFEMLGLLLKKYQYDVCQLFIFVGVILSFWRYYANEYHAFLKK